MSYSRTSEPVKFERDCAAVLVPQGEAVTLPAPEENAVPVADDGFCTGGVQRAAAAPASMDAAAPAAAVSTASVSPATTPAGAVSAPAAPAVDQPAAPAPAPEARA